MEAQNIATRNQQQAVDVEHLLLALLEQEGGLVPRLFEKAKVAPDLGSIFSMSFSNSFGRSFRQRECDDAAAGRATGLRSSGRDDDKLAAVDKRVSVPFPMKIPLNGVCRSTNCVLTLVLITNRPRQPVEQYLV